MHLVIGAGGVGSILLPILMKSVRDEIVVMDGDKFEEKNLDRQLFSPADIGKNKADALAALYMYRKLKTVPHFFYNGFDIKITHKDTIWCCADNHSCRNEVLNTCDNKGCVAIIGGNEYMDAEAYYYEPKYKDSVNDPRCYYPNITKDKTNDPVKPSCIEEIQTTNPQTAIANAAAAIGMLHLYWFHNNVAKNMGEETEQYWPTHHHMNQMKFFTVRKQEEICIKE
jgi:molybdopterin/thiamine biosynthesis adenylyltransferase